MLRFRLGLGEGERALKILDEKGRVFGKINIVDLLVLVILIGSLAWFGYGKFVRNIGSEISSREQPIEITVLVTGVRPTTAEAIGNSTGFFEFTTGSKIGEFCSLYTEPSDTWEIWDDGRWMRSKNPDKVDAYVTIRGVARIGQDTVTMNGVEVRVGTSIGLKSKMVQVQGNILTVNFHPEEDK